MCEKCGCANEEISCQESAGACCCGTDSPKSKLSAWVARGVVIAVLAAAAALVIRGLV